MRHLSPYKLHHSTAQVDFVPDAQVTIPTRNRFNKWLVKQMYYVHVMLDLCATMFIVFYKFNHNSFYEGLRC